MQFKFGAHAAMWGIIGVVLLSFVWGVATPYSIEAIPTWGYVGVYVLGVSIFFITYLYYKGKYREVQRAKKRAYARTGVPLNTKNGKDEKDNRGSYDTDVDNPYLWVPGFFGVTPEYLDETDTDSREYSGSSHSDSSSSGSSGFSGRSSSDYHSDTSSGGYHGGSYSSDSGGGYSSDSGGGSDGGGGGGGE